MKKITFIFMLLAPLLALAQPTSAPSAPPHAQADVVAAYSDAYTSVTLTPTTFGVPGNNSSAQIISAAGNDVYEVTHDGLDFLGFDLSAPLNAGSMENFHMDFWVDAPPTGAVVIIKWSNHANGHLSGETDAFIYTETTVTGGTWNSIDIPFSAFNNAAGQGVDGRSVLSQLVLNVGSASGIYAPIYIDNLYFWRNPVDPNADATLSDLLVDGVTVDGFSSGVTSYDVELPNGTMTVPTVTATATQGASSISIMDATMIPGSTTVTVTAPNGTDTEVYTINFTEAAALPPTAAPTPPARAVEDVVSVYSNAYTNEVPSGFIAFGPTMVSDVQIEGDDTLQWIFPDPGLGFQYEYSPGSATEGLDLTAGFTKMHIDVYVSGGEDPGELILVQLLNWNGGGFDPIFVNIDLNTTGIGSWYSADIDLSSFNNPSGVALNAVQLVQIIGQGGSGGFGPVYIDNIYFHNDTVLSTEDFNSAEFKVFPNPTNNNWTIVSNNVVTDIQIYDILGKAVLNVKPNLEVSEIDASSLNKGVYFASITTNKGRSTVKLVKN